MRMVNRSNLSTSEGDEVGKSLSTGVGGALSLGLDYLLSHLILTVSDPHPRAAHHSPLDKV